MVVVVVVDHQFLVPAEGVEAPSLQVVVHAAQPSRHVVAVFLVPEVAVFHVAQGGGVEVVQADRPKRIALGVPKPPAAVALLELKKSGMSLRSSHPRGEGE